jgi:hypothetical protein
MNKIHVIFCPGSYGTYLAWAIYSYSNLNTDPIIMPFTEAGSAHNFRKYAGFIKVQAKHEIDASTVDCVIVTPTQYVTYLNNRLVKFKCGLGIDDASLQNWGEHSDSTWARREYYSLVVGDLLNTSKTQYDFTTVADNINFIRVDAERILFDLVAVLKEVYAKFNLTCTSDLTTILENHEKYMSLQPFMYLENTVNEILDGVLNSKLVKIAGLPLLAEAYIQHVLREQGYDLQCHGLDEFPSDTLSLRKLLTRNND